MWRELVESVCSECTFAPPGDEQSLNDIEAALGVALPPELRALHQQQYIGVCMLESNRENPDVLLSGFTGVLPDWAGRGAAKALKAHSLLHAKQIGFRCVETSNLSINRGICAINNALGFQIVRKHLHTYPTPIPAVVGTVNQ